MTRQLLDATLPLSFSAPPLRDNDRRHWRTKATLTRALREEARVRAAAARLPRGLDAVTVVLHWQPASNRRRDPLSPAPTLKPLIDGLVDYGLIADDDTRHMRHPSCCIHDWQANVQAGCWLTIQEVPLT